MTLKKIILSGIFLCFCILLPFLTGQIPQLGSIISPMHIPVFVCGAVCGWPYGAVIGFIAPLLRSVLTGGFPPMFPTAVAMAFELFAYGAFIAVLSQIFAHKKYGVYTSLIISMILGRIVWGIVMLLLTTASGSEFTFSIFIASAFINGIPGMVVHIIVVPIIISIIEKTGMANEYNN